jgi:hypothetical protein
MAATAASWAVVEVIPAAGAVQVEQATVARLAAKVWQWAAR